MKTARLLLFLTGGAAGAFAQQPAAPPAHLMLTGSDLIWGDPPPALPTGARAAILAGNPAVPGPFVVRLQVPAGYKILPHWHPTEENVTVLSGTFALGMGETFDLKSMKDLPAGAYAKLPAEMRHYAVAKTDATIQIHGTGPFTLTYVNPADDPRNKK